VTTAGGGEARVVNNNKKSCDVFAFKMSKRDKRKSTNLKMSEAASQRWEAKQKRLSACSVSVIRERSASMRKPDLRNLFGASSTASDTQLSNIGSGGGSSSSSALNRMFDGADHEQIQRQKQERQLQLQSQFEEEIKQHEQREQQSRMVIGRRSGATMKVRASVVEREQQKQFKSFSPRNVRASPEKTSAQKDDDAPTRRSSKRSSRRHSSAVVMTPFGVELEQQRATSHSSYAAVGKLDSPKRRGSRTRDEHSSLSASQSSTDVVTISKAHIEERKEKEEEERTEAKEEEEERRRQKEEKEKEERERREEERRQREKEEKEKNEEKEERINERENKEKVDDDEDDVSTAICNQSSDDDDDDDDDGDDELVDRWVAEKRKLALETYSDKTLLKSTSCKVAIERYYDELLHSRAQRMNRRREALGKMRQNGYTAENQTKKLEELDRYESMLLRARRKRINQDSFELVRVIGRGGFGEVQLVRMRDTGQVFAMKVMKKKRLIRKKQETHVRSERNALADNAEFYRQNPWVVKLYYSFQDPDYLYLVMEFIPGGDMMHLLIQLDVFPVDLTRFYIAEIVLAIESIHAIDYIHRDLKV
jgi:Protein kinase domain